MIRHVQGTVSRTSTPPPSSWQELSANYDRHSHRPSSSQPSPPLSLLLRRTNLPLSRPVRPSTPTNSVNSPETENKPAESISSKTGTQSEPLPAPSTPYVRQEPIPSGSRFHPDPFGIDRLKLQRPNPLRLRIRFGSLRTRWVLVRQETDGRFCFRRQPFFALALHKHVSIPWTLPTLRACSRFRFRLTRSGDIPRTLVQRLRAHERRGTSISTPSITPSSLMVACSDRQSNTA